MACMMHQPLLLHSHPVVQHYQSSADCKRGFCSQCGTLLTWETTGPRVHAFF